ncbi:SUMO-conjugating enzyme ubc9 [Podospora conica]|nr:SUMO-conjugating enzyme ubc9 [Schizothecium conicum]
MAADTTLRKRLLSDIAELQAKPYPNIRLHITDRDVTKACLVLTPARSQPLHLRVSFPHDYPLRPPSVEIDTQIAHPNIFGTYICASILNTTDGYTPAYTLKGIAIQLLSFFSSESLEQDGGYEVNLDEYQARLQRRHGDRGQDNSFQCQSCRYGMPPSRRAGKRDKQLSPPDTRVRVLRPSTSACSIDTLPDELLLLIIEDLDFEELTMLARAWARVGDLITRFDVVRVRELQCFVVKEDFHTRKLGVGVSVGTQGRQGKLQSEFDLLSEAAFTQHKVRESIHHVPFSRWLPLPISHGHWRRVRNDADDALVQIAADARITGSDNVLYAFMNDVIVQLNADLEAPPGHQNWRDMYRPASTLRHASEKAIESYFHLFHLLLCLAVERPSIVARANRMIADFLGGRTTKADVPNLGYLLTALLISDHHPTEALMKKIVTEAITRNVVWMLDGKGAGLLELGYLETDAISQYRLKKTFEGSRTSYRLLMFSELFRRTARPGPTSTPPQTPSPAPPPTASTPTTSYLHAATSPPPPAPSPSPSDKTPLPHILTDLFSRHGAPPPGTAAHMAAEVRRLQKISDFPSFLREMGIATPSASAFTSVLRDTVRASATLGYSRDVEALAPQLALVRLRRDPTVTREGVAEELEGRGWRLPEGEVAGRMVREAEAGMVGFFPGDVARRGGGRGRGGGR